MSIDRTKIKIIISFILSFILSIAIYPFIELSPKPHINTAQFQKQLYSIQKNGEKVFIGFSQNIKSLGMITSRLSYQTITPFPSKTAVPTSQQNTSFGFQIIPTSAVKYSNSSSQSSEIPVYETPQITSSVFQPTNEIEKPSIILPSRIPTVPYKPTSKPKPTHTPKPTKIPKPTSLILQTIRPGKNKEEVLSIAAKENCVPEAMLRAIYLHETGWSPYWVSQYTEPWSEKNTYQGIDSAESESPTKIMGPMQMMADTWLRIKPGLSKKYGGVEMSIDVFFDAVSGAAYHIRNVSLAGNEHASCDDWSLRYIAKGACKYGASCGGAADYCTKICNSYNTFTKGPKKNCSALPTVISMDGLCQLK